MFLSYIYRTVIVTLLSTLYAVQCALYLAFYYVTHPFSNCWTPKLRLNPPEPLKDPKYGVHKYVKVNNIKMHYVESGDPSNKLMIFVHGFPEFWYTWRHQIVEFQKKYWVVAIDLRGYGDSEKPENVSDYQLPLLVDDLRDLINALGREKAIMIAHDWGALIAWEFRKYYPDMLEALVSMGGTEAETWKKLFWTNMEQFKLSQYVLFLKTPWFPEIKLRMNDLEFFEEMRKGVSKEYITDIDIECYKYIFGKPAAFTSPINIYRANTVTRFYKTPQFKKLPTMVINGENDVYIISQNLIALKTLCPDLEVTIMEKCTHFLHQSNPCETNDVIKHFLIKHSL